MKAPFQIQRKIMQEPQVFTFSIDQENKGTRIDLVLSLQLEEVSRSFIQKLIEQGNVRVNGNRELSKKYKVAAGDEYSSSCRRRRKSRRGRKISLLILYMKTRTCW